MHSQSCGLETWMMLATTADDPVRVFFDGKGWTVELVRKARKDGAELRIWLKRSRGGRRRWKSIGSVATFLVDQGVREFSVTDTRQGDLPF